MKKIITLIILFTCILTFSETEITGKRIQVSGTSSKEFFPNSAKFSFTITTSGESVEKANIENNKYLEKYKHLLNKLETKYEKIESTDYSTSETKEWETIELDKGKTIYDTYLNIDITSIDVNSLEKLILALAEYKITKVNINSDKTYSFSINETAPTRQESYAKVTSIFHNIQNTLALKGFDKNSIKISGYNIDEDTINRKTETKEKTIYTVTHSYEITTRDLKNISNFPNLASVLNINMNNSVKFDVDNKEKIEDELYKTAYEEALDKAQVILKKTKLELKKPVTITDNSRYTIRPYYTHFSSRYYKKNSDFKPLEASEDEILKEMNANKISIIPEMKSVSKTVYIEFEMN